MNALSYVIAVLVALILLIVLLRLLDGGVAL